MHNLSRLVFLSIGLILSGCTQRFQDTTDTIKEALFGFENIEMSREHVTRLPYASAYARINHGHRIFLVLAYAERNPATGITQNKWMSSDKAMIVTENGRVVKTLSLPETNLVSLFSSESIPNPSSHTPPWKAQYDWQPDYNFGHQAHIESHLVKDEWVESLLWSKQTQLIEETVKLDGHANSVTNHYWIDEQGKVVKSAQWAVPEQLHIELEILKAPFDTEALGN